MSELSIDRARDATRELLDTLHDAEQWLLSCSVDAMTCCVPLQGLEDEDPPVAPVEFSTGKPAIKRAISALVAVNYLDHQHPKSTIRRPAMLQLDCSDAQMLEWIEEVNRVKAALKSSMLAITYSQWKINRAKVDVWKRLNKLQAYRQWIGSTTALSAVNFSWAGHSVGAQQIRIADLLADLRKKYEKAPAIGLGRDIERLADYEPDEVVVLRRPTAPAPIINLRYAPTGTQLFKHSAPILTTRELPNTYYPLEDFNLAKSVRTRRSDAMTELEPLVDAPTYAFRYLPEYRYHLRHAPHDAKIQWIDAGQTQVEIAPKGRKSHFESMRLAARPSYFNALADLTRQIRGPIAHDQAQNAAFGEDIKIIPVAVNRAFVTFDTVTVGLFRCSTSAIRKLSKNMN